MNFDLDSPQTWSAALRQLVDGKMDESVEDKAISKAEDILRCAYSDVIAYHACTILNPESYLQHGLMPASETRWLERAREIFNDTQEIDQLDSQEVTEVVEANSEWYRGTVSMYISAIDALPYCSSYQGEGYVLKRIAEKLGGNSKEKLESYFRSGNPAFIRCVIPISWLESEICTVESPLKTLCFRSD